MKSLVSFRGLQKETDADAALALKQKMDSVLRLSNTEEQIDALDSAKAGVQQLSLEVADASVYVPAHDQRTYSDVSNTG